MEHIDPSLRLIPLFPLLAAVLSGLWLLFARNELPRLAVAVGACAAPVLAFVFSFRAVFKLTTLPAGDRYLVDNVYTWISAHPFHAEMQFLLDPLSAVMVLVVTGIGSLIHIYSVGYMADDHRDDQGFQRFMVYMNLFTFSMLMLVLGDNLLVMFVGWEGVGLCSYLLIGFWYLDDHNAAAGQKAFVVNRIGDFGFLLGIFLLFWAFYQAGHPTIEFREMASLLRDPSSGVDLATRVVTLPEWLSFLPAFPTWKLITLACLCLFIGACGKSAQLPLYVWLPDAMAGPTPVSALIHAATMVTAGVYMICRMSFAYSLAPGAQATVAWVGAVTAFFAAVIALCQKDIKKVLAYSTVSQLGYMFVAAGVAAYSAALLHLTTHAFFKALLFLAAGSVILGMHHEQNMDHMGGLWDRMRRTAIVFVIGVLAITGFPGFAGFFSKDEILRAALQARDIPGNGALYTLCLLTAGLTAFYMFRLWFLTFTGETRAPVQVRRNIHEQPAIILSPLWVLAVLSIFGGALLGFPDAWGEPVFGVPEANSMHHFVDEVVHSDEHEIEALEEFGLAMAAFAVAGIGAALAAFLYYYRTDLLPSVSALLRPLYGVVYNKFWVDELYDAVIVRPLIRLSDTVLYRVIDQRLIDGLGVNGVAALVTSVADRGLKFLQTGFTQSYVFGMVVGGAVIVAYMVRGL